MKNFTQYKIAADPNKVELTQYCPSKAQSCRQYNRTAGQSNAAGAVLRKSYKEKQSGFSLIEIMIVIVIIGILVKIAVPAYTSYTQKAYRTDAKTALLDLASREEKYYSVYNQYTADPTKLYGATSTFPLNVQSGGKAYYQLTAPTVTAATGTVTATFVAQAVPISTTSQANDACAIFQINSYGAQSNVNNTTSNCW